MNRYAQENLISAVLLAVFIGVIILCQDFGPRARMIPLPLAILGIVLTLIQIAWHNLGSTQELQMDLIQVQPLPDGVAPAVEPSVAKKSSWQREAGAYGIVTALLALILVVGIMPAIFIFTAGYFLLSGYCAWQASLFYTALFTATAYLLFVVALEMQPYHGLLAPLLP